MRFVPPGSIRGARDLAPLLEQSVLKPEATGEDVLRACAEGRDLGLAGVCVRPAWVRTVARELAGAAARVVSVVDFPEGLGSTARRAEEAQRVVADGAQEVDVVMALAPLRGRDLRALFLDLDAIVAAAGVPVKVILETCRLSDEEKVAACAVACAAGVAWVKTSTGFAEGGATAEDVARMRRVVGTGVGVKASGGIRTAEQAMAMVQAGADRIGTSSAVAIVGGVIPGRGASS